MLGKKGGGKTMCPRGGGLTGRKGGEKEGRKKKSQYNERFQEKDLGESIRKTKKENQESGRGGRCKKRPFAKWGGKGHLQRKAK